MDEGRAAGTTNRGRLNQALTVGTALILVVNLASALLVATPVLADNPGVYFLEAAADAYVQRDLANDNFGDRPYLNVGPAPEFGEPQRAFLRFDPGPLPDDAVIANATFNIYLFEASQGPDPVSLSVRTVLEPWTEMGSGGITWNSRPGSTFYGTAEVTTADGWKQFDVTDMVQGWLDGSANYGLSLRATDEGGDVFTRTFYSRESAKCGPYLEISYTTEGVPPESPAPPACDPGSDTTPPQMTINADPDPGLAGSPVHIEAEARDDGAGDTGTYRLELLQGVELVDDAMAPGGAPTLMADYTFTPDAGMYRFSAVAWDMDMNPAVTSIRLQVYEDGTPPRVWVEHEPLNPTEGMTVTFRAGAEDDSLVNHITLSIDGVPHDYHFDPPQASPTITPLDINPGERRIIRYRASATDQEGFYHSTGTKYVLLGDLTGLDSDGDHISDEIEALLGIDPDNNDTDGDGLYDGWEVLGFDRGWDGTVEVDLPMLGASPYHKDVFVEMDWMESSTFSYQLHPVGIQAVVNTLADYGLRLHVDTGQLGGGNALPWESSIGDQWGWMNATKRANFDEDRLGLFYYVAVTPHVGPKTSCGTVGDRWFGRSNMFVLRRSSGGYATPARNAELFIHELGHAIGLGHGGQRAVTPYTVHGLGPDGVATTFTLDWAFDDENNKPHYFSNMNYRYQYQLKVRTDDGEDVYLYGYHVAPSLVLDETALDEAAGFEADAVFGRYLWRRCVTAEECEDEWHLFHSWLEGTYYLRPHRAYELPLPDPLVDDTCTVYTEWFLGDGSWIDWNLNGVVDPAPLEWDVDQKCSCRDGGTDCDCACEWTTSSELVAPFEPLLLEPKIYGWESDFSFSVADAVPADGPGGEINSPEPNDPPAAVTDGELPDNRDNDGDGLIDEGFADADGDKVADMIDNCPLTVNPDQTDTNRNFIGDDCEEPPDTPGGLTVEVVAGKPRLAWTANAGADVVGYNVYRQGGVDADFRRLGNPFPTVLQASFDDAQCINGATYEVSAVDLNMNEGARSKPVTLGEDMCQVFPVYLPLVLRNAP